MITISCSKAHLYVLNTLGGFFDSLRGGEVVRLASVTVALGMYSALGDSSLHLELWLVAKFCSHRRCPVPCIRLSAAREASGSFAGFLLRGSSVAGAGDRFWQLLLLLLVSRIFIHCGIACASFLLLPLRS